MLLAVMGCQRQIETGTVTRVGTAELRSPNGAAMGSLILRDTPTGLEIAGSLTGLTPGAHGIHVHQAGRCEGPEFTTAGGHLNPAGRRHGLENAEGPHAGDLPNVVAGSNGTAPVTLTTPRVTLSELFDADGSAVVVHASADDQRSDPAGNSGARVACGVVR